MKKRIKWSRVVLAIICLIAIIDLIISTIKTMAGANLTSMGFLVNGFEIVFLYFIETNYF